MKDPSRPSEPFRTPRTIGRRARSSRGVGPFISQVALLFVPTMAVVHAIDPARPRSTRSPGSRGALGPRVGAARHPPLDPTRARGTRSSSTRRHPRLGSLHIGRLQLHAHRRPGPLPAHAGRNIYYPLGWDDNGPPTGASAELPTCGATCVRPTARPPHRSRTLRGGKTLLAWSRVRTSSSSVSASRRRTRRRSRRSGGGSGCRSTGARNTPRSASAAVTWRSSPSSTCSRRATSTASRRRRCGTPTSRPRSRRPRSRIVP